MRFDCRNAQRRGTHSLHVIHTRQKESSITGSNLDRVAKASPGPVQLDRMNVRGQRSSSSACI
jgi:hypothetical protein